jgi:hypothetical protein
VPQVGILVPRGHLILLSGKIKLDGARRLSFAPIAVRLSLED